MTAPPSAADGWTLTVWRCDECEVTAQANTFGEVADSVRLVHGDPHRLTFPVLGKPLWLDQVPAGVDVQISTADRRRRWLP